MLRLIKICLFGFCCSLSAYCHIYGGPEIYHVKRERDNGSMQSGTLWGGRFGIERIKRWGFYLGGDVLFAEEGLDGKWQGLDLTSDFQEVQVEGRTGYQLACGCVSFTPIAGIGYFRSTNDFSALVIEREPYELRHRAKFGYTLLGFLSEVKISCWSLGVNFKVRYPFDGRNRITDSTKPEPLDQVFVTRTQYVVELPLSFQSRCFGLSVVPFYRFRHYGRQEGNYPDGKDTWLFPGTKFRIWGARILFVIKW